MNAESMKNGQDIIQHLNNNEQNPLISVVVMTYKNQNCLYTTLDTILNQNYPNIELIIKILSPSTNVLANSANCFDFIIWFKTTHPTFGLPLKPTFMELFRFFLLKSILTSA